MVLLLIISYTDGSKNTFAFNSREEALAFVQREGDHVLDYKVLDK